MEGAYEHSRNIRTESRRSAHRFRGSHLPPDLICRREWIAGGRYLEDTTQGTAAGGTYWRRGWLGYSNMDRRYEWVTVDAVNTTMMSYAGALGSGSKMPITMSGVFTDQGVAGEQQWANPYPCAP
jgi:hypothetical protein